jgi:hypothetical protein
LEIINKRGGYFLEIIDNVLVMSYYIIKYVSEVIEMKKTKLFELCGLLLFSFLMILLVDGGKVSALNYDYTGGKIEKTHEEVVVNSFSYDYITKFNDGFVYDNGTDVSKKEFYSGKSISLSVDEYEHWWFLTKDDDATFIYKYNDREKAFSTSVTSFDNKSGVYTFDKGGIYKVLYVFEGKTVHVSYIYIFLDIHKVEVTTDSKYENISAYSNFSFTLRAQDAYDLRNNKYYYAFGVNQSNLKFKEFTVFTSAEKKMGDPITKFEKELTVTINDSDTSIEGQKKYFFVKVVAGGTEKIVSTENTYELASKIQANVYLVDEKGKKISGDKMYKRNETIRFSVVLNAPVTYEGLQYTVDGKNFIALEDCKEETRKIDIKYVVQSYNDFSGSFSLKTRSNAGVVVKYNGENASVNVVSNMNFKVDVSVPKISVLEDGDANGLKEYVVTINVDEDNLQQVWYYAAECSVSQGRTCLDGFDETNESIVNLGASAEATVKLDGKFGSYDKKNVALFVKAVDKAGNIQTFTKWGYVIDNVIVPEGEAENIFKFIDIVEGENVVGKKLSVEFPNSYGVVSASYNMPGTLLSFCVKNMENLEKTVFDCLEIVGYDFNSEVTVYLSDSSLNSESYKTEFKYSAVKDGNILVGNKNFDLHSGLEYEIEFKMFNYMKENQDPLVFEENVFMAFRENLHLNNLPSMNNLIISLVYIHDGEIKVLKDKVGSSLVFPTVNELMTTLSDLRDFKKCAVEKCDISIYLKYDYDVNGVPQTRLVKINYIDNSNKYRIDDFKYENTVAVGGMFVEFNYKYLDNLNININPEKIEKKRKIMFEDKSGNLREVEEIDASVIGKYIVSEVFTYNSNNSFPLTYTIDVKDEVIPMIRLNGKKKITINVGETFKDPSVVTNDNYDKDVIVYTKIDPELDVNKVGKYVISYWCEDSSGNVSETITRTIIVVEGNDVKTYLIAGGIGVFTIVIVVVGTIIEIKKEKRKK